MSADSLIRPHDPEWDLFNSAALKYEAPKDIHPDPVAWAKRNLGIDLWSKQRSVLRMIDLGVPKLAVPSCNDSGKSFISSIIAARFLAKHMPGSARVITTAPVGDQVRGVLWNEINQRHAEAEALHKATNGTVPKLPGRVNQTEWWIGGYQAGIGRKPSESGLAEKFAGYHAEYILVIIDEAGAVAEELWTGVDTLATNAGAQILAIGNPTDPKSEFARICDGTLEKPGPRNGWEVIRISAWSTPNFSGEIVTPKIKRVMLAPIWVEEKRDTWGEDDARWESRIEAKFPSESSMTVIRSADVLVAQSGVEMDEEAAWEAGLNLEDVQLGVDIAASETGDETVIRERRGHRICRRWSIRSADPEKISDQILFAARESGATIIHVDATGVGFGFLGDIRRALPDVVVKPFISAEKATDSKQFVNRRAEVYWNAREMFRKRRIDLSSMDESWEKGATDTISQITDVRYKLDKGRILIEPKADIRKRNSGRSPDDADAFMLCIAAPSDGIAPSVATVHATTKRRVIESTKTDGPRQLGRGEALGERVADPNERRRPMMRALRSMRRYS